MLSLLPMIGRFIDFMGFSVWRIDANNLLRHHLNRVLCAHDSQPSSLPCPRMQQCKPRPACNHESRIRVLRLDVLMQGARITKNGIVVSTS